MKVFSWSLGEVVVPFGNPALGPSYVGPICFASILSLAFNSCTNYPVLLLHTPPKYYLEVCPICTTFPETPQNIPTRYPVRFHICLPKTPRGRLRVRNKKFLILWILQKSYFILIMCPWHFSLDFIFIYLLLFADYFEKTSLNVLLT